MQNYCQEVAFRIDIKYSREYISVFPGISLPSERNNRKNFLRILGESTEARLLGTKNTEERMPKNRLFHQMIKVPLQNNV